EDLLRRRHAGRHGPHRWPRAPPAAGRRGPQGRQAGGGRPRRLQARRLGDRVWKLGGARSRRPQGLPERPDHRRHHRLLGRGGPGTRQPGGGAPRRAGAVGRGVGRPLFERWGPTM
ncbi:MAG: Carboxysome peptide A, partial [uncultured Acidimicrobiales bacterium]